MPVGRIYRVPSPGVSWFHPPSPDVTLHPQPPQQPTPAQPQPPPQQPTPAQPQQIPSPLQWSPNTLALVLDTDISLLDFLKPPSPDVNL